MVVPLCRSRAVKNFTPLSKANNLSILGKGMRVSVPFLVPVAEEIVGNSELSFL